MVFGRVLGDDSLRVRGSVCVRRLCVCIVNLSLSRLNTSVPHQKCTQTIKTIEAQGTLTGTTKEPIVVQRCGELIAVPDSTSGEKQEAPPALALRCHAAMSAVDRACGRCNLGAGDHCNDETCLAALGSIASMVPECANNYPPFPAQAAIEQAQAACAK